MNKELIKHTVENEVISQRAIDGYVNATELAKASGKKLNDYLRLDSSREFFKEVESDTGFPVSELIQMVRGGTPNLQGTWVHPLIAINLGQWLSAKFALQVSKWIFGWMSKGHDFELRYQKFIVKKAEIEKKGSESGRFLANLRWHINPALEKEEREIEEERQLSLFPRKIIH